MRTEVLGVGIGDILKFEATALTRVKVKVSEGTRAGDWVNFSLRDNKLVALTDEQDGYALVQPHNCIIDLRYCAKPENIADTLQQGENWSYVIGKIKSDGSVAFVFISELQFIWHSRYF